MIRSIGTDRLALSSKTASKTRCLRRTKVHTRPDSVRTSNRPKIRKSTGSPERPLDTVWATPAPRGLTIFHRKPGRHVKSNPVTVPFTSPDLHIPE